MPKKIRIGLLLYCAILLICVALLIFAAFSDPMVQEKLFPIAEKAFFMALGACLGALAYLIPGNMDATNDQKRKN